MTGEMSELLKLLDAMETCILTTVSAEGFLRARPMQLQEREDDGTLWFATTLGTHKIEDLRRDARCCVAFLKSATYISVSGQGELVKDEAKIKQLWKPGWRGWFPEGPGEADLVLLKVIPEHVEWVHPEGGMIHSAWTQVKNAVTGEREEPAEHKELDLHTRH